MSDTTVVEMPTKKRNRKQEKPKEALNPCPKCGEPCKISDLPAHVASCAGTPDDPTAERPANKPPVKVSREPLPMPPRFACSPPEFFRYWASLKPDERPRIVVYPYRGWPKMDYTRGLSPEEIQAIARKEKKAPTSNLGPLSEPWPIETWREEVLHRWGSGNYHLKLNDTGVRGNKDLNARTLCQTTTGDIIDPNYPPVVELEKLDIFAETNASYIRDLKLKGVKIPGITEDEQETTDMAGAAAAETMANTVKDLTGEVVKMAAASRAQPPHVDVSSQAQLKASEIIAEASKESIRMVTDAARRDAEANDPKAYVKDLVTMAELITPKSNGNGTDNSAVLIAMMQQQQQQTQLLITQMQTSQQLMLTQMQQSHQETMKSMESRLAFTETMLKDSMAKQNPQPATTSMPNALTDLLKIVEAVERVKEKMSSGTDKNAGGPWWAEPAMELANKVVGAAETITHNVAVARTGQGTPAAPSETIEAGAQEAETEMDAATAFWNQVKPQLTKALQDGIPGYVFGAQLALANGTPAYNQLHNLGEQGIYQFISAKDQQFWTWTRSFAQQFGNFVQEFLDVEKVKQAAQELQITREEAAAPPAPPPAAAPRPAQPRPAAAPQPKSASGPPRPQAVVDATKTQQ